MKITPIEIRQHTFEKGLRGYKPEDVDAFLVSLSQEWERVTGEYKMLKMQLELAEKELGKLKEVEMTLFRTLKTAEDTSTQITDQATKAGEKYIADSQQKADEILAEARKRAALMVQDAENKSRFLKDTILNDLRSLEHDFKALEGYKENLGVQIRTLASNAVDSIDRFEKKFARQNLKGKLDEATNQLETELKAYDDQKSPENGAIEPAASTDNPATDLPALIEREASIPEAIPEDKDLVEKLDEAIDQSTPATSDEVEKTTESVMAEVNMSDVEPQPDTVAEESQEKKGGSFFDQI
jgi:cell division initiation protein